MTIGIGLPAAIPGVDRTSIGTFEPLTALAAAAATTTHSSNSTTSSNGSTSPASPTSSSTPALPRSGKSRCSLTRSRRSAIR